MSGFSTPCSSMFMLPMRSMVLSKSKPWNMLVVEVLAQLLVAEQARVVLAQIFARGDQEAAGAAGGIADHVRRAVGAVISTMSAMMWRGVRNWPFWPAVAIFASMYS